MEFVVANLEDLRSHIAREFERLAAAGPLSCGLSGGPTALIFLGALRTAKPDWSRVSLFWVDERAVPPDHADSNYKMAHDALLSAESDEHAAGHVSHVISRGYRRDSGGRVVRAAKVQVSTGLGSSTGPGGEKRS